MTSVGFTDCPVVASAARNAGRSLTSATLTTCQPSPVNRVPTSSEKASEVRPSMVIPLSS